MSAADEQFLPGEEAAAGETTTVPALTFSSEAPVGGATSLVPNVPPKLQEWLLDPADDGEAVKNACEHVRPLIYERQRRATHAGYYELQELYGCGVAIKSATGRRQPLLVRAIGGVWVDGNLWRSVAHAGVPELQDYPKGSPGRKPAMNNLYRKAAVLEAAWAASLPTLALAEVLKTEGIKNLSQPKKSNQQTTKRTNTANSGSAYVGLTGPQVHQWQEEPGRSLMVTDRRKDGSELIAYLTAPALAGYSEKKVLTYLEAFLAAVDREQSTPGSVFQTRDDRFLADLTMQDGR